MATTGQAPLVEVFRAPVAPVATGSDYSTVVCAAPYDATVTAVKYVPNTTITGAATNTRKHDLLNKGQDGSGSTNAASLQYNNGVNAPAFDAKDITLSGTAANLAVVAGDVLAFASTHVGTGLADPGGTVEVTLSRNQ